MNPILQVRDLHVEYRLRGACIYALRGVSFNVRPGEILAVLGESGSGKSTLAAALLRVLPAPGAISRGQIILDGQKITQLGPRALRLLRGKRIAMIPQEPSLALHPVMRIGDQVAEVLRAHESLDRATRRKRALHTLSQVFSEDVERLANSYPHELSGGQRQRAMIAQAIACGPSVIVADEPTSALDVSTQRDVAALFGRLRKQLGIAFVFITHNPALLLALADRVLVLYAGRLVECGRAEDVLLAPQHPYTQALMKCFPRGSEEGFINNKMLLPVIAGAAPNLSILSSGCIFEPRCQLRMAICQTRDPLVETLPAEHDVACLKFAS